jgi:hypothetical protein
MRQFTGQRMERIEYSIYISEIRFFVSSCTRSILFMLHGVVRSKKIPVATWWRAWRCVYSVVMVAVIDGTGRSWMYSEKSLLAFTIHSFIFYCVFQLVYIDILKTMSVCLAVVVPLIHVQEVPTHATMARSLVFILFAVDGLQMTARL